VTRLVILLGVLLLSTAGGLVWRRANGRLRARTEPAPTTEPADRPPPVPAGVLADLGVDPAAAPVTLLQFSSAFCAPCRATRRVLGEVVDLLPAVHHVEVDAEAHLDSVRALSVLRTPTVLILDGTGRVVNRASGQPRKADVVAAVAPYLSRS
jgi:thiol-disulfide isomerase/thioredoxin